MIDVIDMIDISFHTFLTYIINNYATLLNSLKIKLKLKNLAEK